MNESFRIENLKASRDVCEKLFLGFFIALKAMTEVGESSMTSFIKF